MAAAAILTFINFNFWSRVCHRVQYLMQYTKFHQYGTDTTDIRIQINPKIRIQIPDHFFSTITTTTTTTTATATATTTTTNMPSLVRAILVRSIENGISGICCFRGVILSPYNCS